MTDLKRFSMFLAAFCLCGAVVPFSAGAGSPAPPSFIILSDTTIMDENTALVWAPDAGAPAVEVCSGGKMTFQAANVYIACLNTVRYLGHSDWRLPKVEDLTSLMRPRPMDESSTISAWLRNQGFRNVQTSYYWTSSADPGTDIVQVVDLMWSGYIHPVNKASVYYTWPVRGGR